MTGPAIQATEALLRRIHGQESQPVCLSERDHPKFWGVEIRAKDLELRGP